MKIKFLLLLCVILAGSRCYNPAEIQKSDIEVILQRIDCSGSGYVYMYDNGTIKNELSYFDSLLKSKTLSPLMTELIGIHLKRTKMMEDSFPDFTRKYMTSGNGPSMIAFYVKPPNPCPQPGSTCIKGAKVISYYSFGSKDSIRVDTDGQPVPQAAAYYDKTTKIKTVEFQNNIEALRIIQVTRMDDQKVVATYTEYVQEDPNQ